MFSYVYMCPDDRPTLVLCTPLTGWPISPKTTQKQQERNLMRQFTEKAIAFVFAVAISSGIFNTLIV
jgi:hypothetical protein